VPRLLISPWRRARNCAAWAVDFQVNVSVTVLGLCKKGSELRQVHAIVAVVIARLAADPTARMQRVVLRCRSSRCNHMCAGHRGADQPLDPRSLVSVVILGLPGDMSRSSFMVASSVALTSSRARTSCPRRTAEPRATNVKLAVTSPR